MGWALIKPWLSQWPKLFFMDFSVHFDYWAWRSSTYVYIPEATRTAIDSLLNVKVARRKGENKMPMKTLEATISTFDEVIQKFTSESPNYKANYIAFLADKDPSTNLSWCPGKNLIHIYIIYLHHCINFWLSNWLQEWVLDRFLIEKKQKPQSHIRDF